MVANPVLVRERVGELLNLVGLHMSDDENDAPPPEVLGSR